MRGCGRRGLRDRCLGGVGCGSVDRIIVLRSSGNKVLDDAAKRIVTIAAPFAPFPPDIRKETDYLDITRTWAFTRGNAVETR